LRSLVWESCERAARLALPAGGASAPRVPCGCPPTKNAAAIEMPVVMPILQALGIGMTTGTETGAASVAGGMPGEPAGYPSPRGYPVLPLVGGAGYPLGAEAPREEAVQPTQSGRGAKRPAKGRGKVRSLDSQYMLEAKASAAAIKEAGGCRMQACWRESRCSTS
jgi:hypothetical protein